jgi:hypothetical protein
MRRSSSWWSRREWLRASAVGLCCGSVSGWLERLAAATVQHPERKRSCILLWMNGGPSQLDTFDPKPGHANGGSFKSINTSVPGIQLAEHLPQLAQRMNDLVVVRSMTTKEADHGRATFLMRTGHAPGTPLQYPPIGALVAKELGTAEAELPNFVSIAPFRLFAPEAYGPGFLGAMHAPLIVGEPQGPLGGMPTSRSVVDQLKVKNLDRDETVPPDHADERLALLDRMEQRFLAEHPGDSPRNHFAAYQRAARMMKAQASRAFRIEEEPTKVRDAYGRSLFGQGCLLARRLVERGVPFVEVTLSEAPGVAGGIGWDTHQNNFEQVRRLCEVLDQAWATLLDDLRDRGLLDTTLVVWMGEFGRTPRINPQRGRDHWANSWSTVLAGGGVRGGQVVGRTSADGMEVADRPVAVADFLATVCAALGIDASKQNDSNLGRPIRLVDAAAKPLLDVVRS